MEPASLRVTAEAGLPRFRLALELEPEVEPPAVVDEPAELAAAGADVGAEVVDLDEEPQAATARGAMRARGIKRFKGSPFG